MWLRGRELTRHVQAAGFNPKLSMTKTKQETRFKDLNDHRI